MKQNSNFSIVVNCHFGHDDLNDTWKPDGVGVSRVCRIVWGVLEKV